MLTIALMGDLHYPVVAPDNDELRQARDPFFAGFFTAFLATKADYHVSIGDITHWGLREEFEAISSYVHQSDVRFRVTLGNHDVLSLIKSEIVTLTGQPRYYAEETDDAILVYLDTTKELELHGWGLDEAQWEWFNTQVQQSPEKTLMVFAHHPVPGTTSSSPHAEAELKPFQDIRPILAERKSTSFYFNGHTHTHSIVKQGQWHYIQTAAAFCHPCFRIIELDGKEIRIQTINFEEDSILKSAKYLHDRLKSFHRPKGTIGEPSDLEYSASLI